MRRAWCDQFAGRRASSVMRSPITSSDGLSGRPFKQRHALAQRRLEIDLAAHRPLGDRRDIGPSAPTKSASSSTHSWPIMVESMSAREQMLAPRRLRLHHDIDGNRAQRLDAGAPGRCAAIVLAPVEGDIDRDSPSEPSPGQRRRLIAARRPATGDRAAGRSRIADERGDKRTCSELPRNYNCRAYRRADRQRQVGARAASSRERLGGVIVNADSMQVYRDLKVLTARPDAAGRGARSAPALRRTSMRRSILGRRAGWPMRRRSWQNASRKTGYRFSPAAPACTSRR